MAEIMCIKENNNVNEGNILINKLNPSTLKAKQMNK